MIGKLFDKIYKIGDTNALKAIDFIDEMKKLLKEERLNGLKEELAYSHDYF
jgi:hypothetical protein